MPVPLDRRVSPPPTARFTPQLDAPPRPHTGGPQRARTSDAPAIAALFASRYGEGSHPAGDPAFVAGSIAAGDIWVVARRRGSVAGCAAVCSASSAGVTEVGCLAVDRAQPDEALENLLADSVMAEARHDLDRAQSVSARRSRSA